MKRYRNISLRAMANKLGISPSYLFDIENGNRNPSYEVYKRICNEYSKGVETLFEIKTEYKVIRTI